MPSECFVINEWLLHDLRGDNGVEFREQSFKFLKKLKERCDHIAVLYGSAWLGKAFELMRHGDPPLRILSKYLHEVILRDPQKCILLNNDQLKLIPEGARGMIPESDLYLIEV